MKPCAELPGSLVATICWERFLLGFVLGSEVGSNRREVSRAVDFYNLDAIISVGYRVNSLRATQFRAKHQDLCADATLGTQRLFAKFIP